MHYFQARNHPPNHQQHLHQLWFFLQKHGVSLWVIPEKNLHKPSFDRIHIWLVYWHTWTVASHRKLESTYSFFTIHGSNMGKKPHNKSIDFGAPVHSGRSPPKKMGCTFWVRTWTPQNIGHSRPFACSRRSVRHLAKTPSDLGRPVMILISVLVESFLVEKKEGTSSGEKIVQTKIQAISIG